MKQSAEETSLIVPQATPQPEGSFEDALAAASYPGLNREEALRRLRLAATYDRLVRDLGATHYAVLWPSRRGQRMRFKALCRIFGINWFTGGVGINDLGCGYGALFNYLRWRPVMWRGRYVGYDLSSRMLETARKRISDPRAHFIQADMATQEMDYSLCSGTFGIKAGEAFREGDSDAAWAAHVRRSIIRLAAVSRRGIAFNLLHEQGRDERDQILYYASPGEWLTFCRDTISADARVISSGSPLDFTVLIPLKNRRC